MKPRITEPTKLLAAISWICAITAQAAAVEFIREKQPFREAATVHINGFSYHKAADRSELNEANYGLGFGYYLGTLESDWPLLKGAAVSVETELYSDSFSKFAYLCGVTFQKELTGYLDYGINVGLIHEDHLVDDIGLYLVPYLFPYLQTRFDTAINARLTIIPPVGNKGVFALQLIARF
jgi:hypothetical protein